MATNRYNLAIEMSGRGGGVALGCGDQWLGEAAVARDQAGADGGSRQGRTVSLMPAVDQLCKAHHVAPADLAEIYVSIGPGSFTGLRIAVATAKALAQVLAVQLVGVPTLDVLAEAAARAGVAPAPEPDQADAGEPRLAVCLNQKRETVYAGLYRPADQGGWAPASEPSLTTLTALIASAPGRVWLVGDPLPPLPDGADHVTVLDPSLARPTAAAVWRVGRRMAAADQHTPPDRLLPLYVRPPEAVELWNKRHGSDEGPAASG